MRAQQFLGVVCQILFVGIGVGIDVAFRQHLHHILAPQQPLHGVPVFQHVLGPDDRNGGIAGHLIQIVPVKRHKVRNIPAWKEEQTIILVPVIVVGVVAELLQALNRPLCPVDAQLRSVLLQTQLRQVVELPKVAVVPEFAQLAFVVNVPGPDPLQRITDGEEVVVHVHGAIGHVVVHEVGGVRGQQPQRVLHLLVAVQLEAEGTPQRRPARLAHVNETYAFWNLLPEEVGLGRPRGEIVSRPPLLVKREGLVRVFAGPVSDHLNAFGTGGRTSG